MFRLLHPTPPSPTWALASGGKLQLTAIRFPQNPNVYNQSSSKCIQLMNYTGPILPHHPLLQTCHHDHHPPPPPRRCDSDTFAAVWIVIEGAGNRKVATCWMKQDADSLLSGDYSTLAASESSVVSLNMEEVWVSCSSPHPSSMIASEWLQFIRTG